jgi:hypothetical protein
VVGDPVVDGLYLRSGAVVAIVGGHDSVSVASSLAIPV